MSRTPDLELPDDDVPVKTGRGTVTFVGTATVILHYAGFTVLTDPNFLHSGDHVRLGYGITAERQTDPALDVDDSRLSTSSCSRTSTATTSTGWRRRDSIGTCPS